MMPTNQNPPPGSPAGGAAMPPPSAMPPAAAGPAPGGDLATMIAQRANDLSPEDMGALQAAPEAIDAIKKLVPEITDALDGLLRSGGTTQGGPPPNPSGGGADDPAAGGGLQRPSTRLGSM